MKDWMFFLKMKRQVQLPCHIRTKQKDIVLIRTAINTVASERKPQMTTSRHFVCKDCGKKEWAEGLFDALRALADSKASVCPICKTARRLELKFTFGLGAGSYEYNVANSYLPDAITMWNDPDGCKVEFFPFLVVLEFIHHDEKAIWLPYWHLHHRSSGVRTKYGQWAPFMNIETYKQLHAKANANGHL